MEINNDNLASHLEYLRKENYNNYLAVIFAKTSNILEILTLFLLELELQKIIDRIKEYENKKPDEYMVALIRLKWWEEEINKIYNNSLHHKHHILTILATIIEKYKIQQEEFATIFASQKIDNIAVNLCRNILNDKEYNHMNSNINIIKSTRKGLLLIIKLIFNKIF
jgi:phytoene/squalene synthetase